MKKKTRKTGKRKSTSKTTPRRSAATSKPASAKPRAAARSPERANPAGSGLVYTDLLREALARRRS
ncbi:MAG TPA: hypothetical protein VII72_12510 [Myxococcota bacterium]|jgi:hypothetical protein